MARILGRLICIFFVFVVVTGGANAYTLITTEGHFTAVFPGEPKLEKSTGKTASGITYNQSSWSFGSSDGNEAWFVMMATYSTPVKKDYVGNISGAVAAVKGRLVSQKTIRQNGVDGREILVDIRALKKVGCECCGSVIATIRSYLLAKLALHLRQTWIRFSIPSNPQNPNRAI